MPFKEHPYCDDSDRDDWIACESSGIGGLATVNAEQWLTGRSAQLAPLVQTLRDQKQALCVLALERIRQQAGKDYLEERPYPELNEFLFHPVSEEASMSAHGFRVYIEYFFNQTRVSASPDSDYWWAIINCPYAHSSFLANPESQSRCNVVGIGWYIA